MVFYHKTSESSKKASRSLDRSLKTKNKSRRRLKIKTKTNKELQPRDKLGQQFLTLFNADFANFSCITAELPKNGKPAWKTIDKYPLKPVTFWNIYIAKTELLGKRFKSETSYGLLDLDINSKYNPDNDPEAYRGLIQALKRLGINKTILVLSSFNGGYHLYFFLPKPLKTYHLAVTLRLKLEAAGFEVKNGQLEIFPNTKPFLKNGFSLYQAHRLPLQTGSFFLNKLGNWSNDLEEFIKEAEESKKEQDISKLKKAAKYYYKKWQKLQWRHKINMKRKGESNLERWESDLREQIKQGFTGNGQTNDLLKIITTHGIVFECLTEDNLVNYIVKTVKVAPGYNKYCRHQHHIKTRAKDWARCGEKMYVPCKIRPKPEDIAKHRAKTNSTYSNTMDSDLFDKNHPIKTEYAARKEEETKNRILDVIQICRRNKTQYPNLKTFMADVSKISKEKYGVGTGYDTLIKYKPYWADLVVSATNEIKTNTQNSTDKNNNTNQSNPETLKKLIFAGNTNLQHTTLTKDQAIQQYKKSSSQNSQIQDVATNSATLVTKNSEKNLDASKASGTSDSTMQPLKSKSMEPENINNPTTKEGYGEKKPPNIFQAVGKRISERATENHRKAQQQKGKRKYSAKVTLDTTVLPVELRTRLEQLKIPLNNTLVKAYKEAITKEGGLDRINKTLDLFELHKHRIGNPGGWLLMALKNNWEKSKRDPSWNLPASDQTETKPSPHSDNHKQENVALNLRITSEFYEFWSEAIFYDGFISLEDPRVGLRDGFGEPRIKVAYYLLVQHLTFPKKSQEWEICTWQQAQKYMDQLKNKGVLAKKISLPSGLKELAKTLEGMIKDKATQENEQLELDLGLKPEYKTEAQYALEYTEYLENNKTKRNHLPTITYVGEPRLSKEFYEFWHELKQYPGLIMEDDPKLLPLNHRGEPKVNISKEILQGDKDKWECLGWKQAKEEFEKVKANLVVIEGITKNLGISLESKPFENKPEEAKFEQLKLRKEKPYILNKFNRIKAMRMGREFEEFYIEAIMYEDFLALEIPELPLVRERLELKVNAKFLNKEGWIKLQWRLVKKLFVSLDKEEFDF